MRSIHIKTPTVVLAVVLAALAGPAPALRAQAPKVRLAVHTLDNPATSYNSTIGNALTDILFTELGRTGRFQLVERAAFEAIAREIDFGSTDWAQKGSVAGRGGTLGADFVLMGKVTTFSFQEATEMQDRTTARGTVQVAMYRKTATVRLDFRIVSTATGVAVVTEFGADAQSDFSELSEIATYRRVLSAGVFTNESENSLIGRATLGAIRNAVRKATDLATQLTGYMAREATGARVEAMAGTSGHVIGVVGGDYFIDLGSASGLKVGDRLTVFGEVLTRNQRGEVIYREEKEVGALQVTDVSMADRAKARLVSGQAVAEGDIVRVDVAGTAATAGLAGAGSGRGAAAPDRVEIERLVRQGDRYIEDRYFAQAVDTYQQALALQPNAPDLLGKLAAAQLYDKQLNEAEATINRLFHVNGEVAVFVLHNHAFGYCQGQLHFSATGIVFEPEKGDHAFTAPGPSVTTVEQSKTLQNGVPLLTVKILDAQRKEKNYDFVMPEYLKPIAHEGFDNITTSYAADQQSLDDTAKMHRMLIRLVQDHMRR